MRTRALVLSLTALAAGGGLAACGGGSDSDSASGKNAAIAVKASDTACEVSTLDLPAGVHTFSVSNKGSKVTEFYVYATGDRVMGEVENVVPGLSRDLKVELPAGEYQTACKPGMVGDGIRKTLKVSGTAPQLSEDKQLAAAVTNYTAYIKAQTPPLIAKTTEFVAAVKANDVDKAKALFPVARTYYERIEPVAEKFGDLDPDIDARDGDVEKGQEWTGFHRLERDLWGAGVSADGAIADKLLADVKKLDTLVQTVELKPLDLANGAKELLDEVASSKVSGEEDRYSHTDLWDFAANVDGSQAAVAALRPVIDAREKSLGTQLDAKFTIVDDLLAQYRDGDGYKVYTDLSKDQVKQLADAVAGIAEPVSQVAGVVTGQ